MNWFHKGMCRILDVGKIPKHIAIIMDGNRRYARNKHLKNVTEGHQFGAEKLRDVIEWFSYLDGIEELSVYAFSLLNFLRAKDEVDGLMDLAEKTFKDFADMPEFFIEHNCAIKFIGRIDMLEERVIKQINRLYQCNVPNPKFVLNICACYTSHDEIDESREKCIQKNIEPTYQNVFDNLQLPHKPDLLIRTSGVYRMSNFLLLQCSHTPIIVTNKLWPELTFWDIAKIIIQYQYQQYLL